jgi:hypothetical protein
LRNCATALLAQRRLEVVHGSSCQLWRQARVPSIAEAAGAAAAVLLQVVSSSSTLASVQRSLKQQLPTSRAAYCSI